VCVYNAYPYLFLIVILEFLIDGKKGDYAQIRQKQKSYGIHLRIYPVVKFCVTSST